MRWPDDVVAWCGIAVTVFAAVVVVVSPLVWPELWA